MSELGKQSVEKTNRRSIALMGKFVRNFDPKKRLTIPSVWRDALGPDLVYVVPDAQRRCLQLIPREMMETRLAKYQELALADPEINDALDAISSTSEMVEFDVQGRIRINDELLAFAGLKGSVLMKGNFRMATLWPAEKESIGMEERVAKLGAAMAKLNF